MQWESFGGVAPLPAVSTLAASYIRVACVAVAGYE